MTLLFASIALLLAVACGGGDDDDGDDASGGSGGDGGTAAAAPSTGGGGSGAAALSGGTGGSGGSGGDGGDGGADELASLFGSVEAAEFIVTFQMEQTSGTDAFTGQWTWYQDPAGDRTRFDIDAVVDGEPLTTNIITTPERTLACSDGGCLGVPQSGGPGGAFPDPSLTFTSQLDLVEAGAGIGSVKPAGTRSIAGEDARCFQVEDAGADVGSGTLCFSERGVPLLMEFKSSDGDFRLEAIDYETSVDDDDFEAPFPVTSLGG
jgi:hypothetical protein